MSSSSTASAAASVAAAASGAPPVVIRNRDMLALKAYIMAKDDVAHDGLPSDMILLDLTHSNLVQQHIEIRFYLSDTVDTLRQRIYQKTGTPHAYQELHIYRNGIHNNNNNNNDYDTIFPSVSPAIKLGYYSLQHGNRIHCMDLNPHSGSRGGQYENVALVKKYRMSDEDYNQRQGTLRDWERQQKQKDQTFSLQKHAIQHAALMEAKRCAKYNLELPKGFVYADDDYDNDDDDDDVNNKEKKRTRKVVRVDDIVEDKDDTTTITTATTTATDANELELLYGIETVHGMDVGMRCQVQPGGRRGVVAYVGLIPELYAGYWVGVHFDEPVGKTDGTAGKNSGTGGSSSSDGTRRKKYFEAQPGYGGFVRGKNVSVGDYPERDIFDEDEYDSQDEL